MITSNQTKSQAVSKLMVWAAYKKVKANGGSAGIDEMSILAFDQDISKNLYKIWNRMTSGSYFPPAVKTVEIPKKPTGKRKLGIPTVSDRIAQTVVKNYLEPQIDKQFSKSSYGYRVGKSAHQAVEQAINNCRNRAWVIDLDIKGFFDNLNHNIMMELLKQHTQEKWIIMYTERWLKAPMEEDGETKTREKGTPQGGVISPLLANIYLHHAFDSWMEENYHYIAYERYADDIIVHCSTKDQAEKLLEEIRKRLKEYELDLHPEKTKIVYCKNYRRKEEYEKVQFTFLGFSFQPRSYRSKQQHGEFLGYGAAISADAQKAINEKIKETKFHRWSDDVIEEIAKQLNPKLRGWLNYYGKFGKWEMNKLLDHLNMRLVKWVQNKYKLTGLKAGIEKLDSIYTAQPKLFAHWAYGFRP
ncbi:MAG: group II intron reverse transcriptase/maturase [Flavobacteria bacterium RIFCSPLOWO2_12_FULL_35_11]|nr:MAG: group II intron reverse transcriptase/maturase [Flavobacteria bacterium RIFCSPLOWO2_12_FULL_35_11]